MLSCMEVLQAAHGVRPAFCLAVELQVPTSASNRDKISTPHFSPLLFRSSSKGSMRMTNFRPGVRPFSTLLIRTNAFWGVSQITMEISAESRKRARGQPLVLPCTQFSLKEEKIFENVKTAGSLKEIMFVNQIYNV